MIGCLHCYGSTPFQIFYTFDVNLCFQKRPFFLHEFDLIEHLVGYILFWKFKFLIKIFLLLNSLKICFQKAAFSQTNDGAAWIGGGLSWVVSPSIFQTSDFGRDYAWTYIFGGKMMHGHILLGARLSKDIYRWRQDYARVYIFKIMHGHISLGARLCVISIETNAKMLQF